MFALRKLRDIMLELVFVKFFISRFFSFSGFSS